MLSDFVPVWSQKQKKDRLNLGIEAVSACPASPTISKESKVTGIFADNHTKYLF
ncbi:hypothetical protein SAMN06265367_101683 [Algoriphagus winogradskyi]|uniref:Uncharacterized protein n=1 Tax=Algoriphagus winogradskyi TaxID=237017 RepID=A0ABY1NFT9_9BACT|nr:hypothetical protein SAMN06265367_101683 [Algoriphagus winogradskyi]